MQEQLIPNYPLSATASAATRQSVYINAAPERVWQLLADINNWPSWQPGVSRIKLTGPLAAGSTFAWKAGMAIESHLHTVEPPFRIGWTGKTFGTNALHNWRLTPDGSGTLVETEESFEGWLPRLLPGLMRKMLAKAIAQGLQELKAFAEKQGRL